MTLQAETSGLRMDVFLSQTLEDLTRSAAQTVRKYAISDASMVLYLSAMI